MERKIDKYLVSWKKDLIRKPLVLYGPKQVGKTFTAINFGKTEYKNIAYFNTYNNEALVNLFTKEKSIDKIILNLSLLADETILEDDTLIILDNLTDSNMIDLLVYLENIRPQAIRILENDTIYIDMEAFNEDTFNKVMDFIKNYI